MTLLPVPQVPPSPHLSSVDVAAVTDRQLADPLFTLEAAITRAEEAVRELQACRPGSAGHMGGQVWREAVDADAETAARGERPKLWKTELLMRGESGRWATASALARSVPAVLAETAKALDRARIATVAGERVDTAAQRWAWAAQRGWEVRMDELAAWTQVRAGEAALGDFLDARSVLEWADGTGPGRPDPSVVRIPHTDHLPADPVGRGYWLALELHLNPDMTWLSFPQDVDWPADVGDLVTSAFPESGDRFVALNGPRGVFERTR